MITEKRLQRVAALPAAICERLQLLPTYFDVTPNQTRSITGSILRCGAEETGCGAEKTGCGAEETGCGAEETGCGAEETGCGAEETGCGAEETGCRAEETGCRAEYFEATVQMTAWKVTTKIFLESESMKENKPHEKFKILKSTIWQV